MALKVLMYSFKGGAGRTVSTANIARLVAVDCGKRVAAIDLDIESAGLSVLFGADRKVELGDCGTIQDILRGFFQSRRSVAEASAAASPVDQLDRPEAREQTTVSFARPRLPEVWSRIHFRTAHSDRLSIVPSRRILDSRREAGPDHDTGRRFGDFLINLQAWSEGPEIILFDSASGVQNTALLGLNHSDVLVIFVRWSRQFVLGTVQFLGELLRNQSRAARRLSRIIVVPTAVPHIEPQGQIAVDLAERRALLQNRISECNYLAQRTLDKPAEWITLSSAIPESESMKWDDRIITGGDQDAADPHLTAVLEAYRSVAHMLVAESERLRS